MTNIISEKIENEKSLAHFSLIKDANLIAKLEELYDDFSKLQELRNLINIKDLFEHPELIELKISKTDLNLEEQNELIQLLNEDFATIKNVFDKNEQSLNEIIVFDIPFKDWTIDLIDEKTDEIIRQTNNIVELANEDIPEEIKENIAYILALSDNNSEHFIDMITSEEVITSPIFNLWLSPFSEKFVARFVELLIQYQDLDCLCVICSRDRALDFDDHLKIVIEIFDECVENCKTMEEVKDIVDFDENIYYNIFKDFKNTHFNFIKQNVFSHIANYISANNSIINEIYANYFANFGSLISLAIADEIKNSILKSNPFFLELLMQNDINIDEMLYNVENKIKINAYSHYYHKVKKIQGV